MAADWPIETAAREACARLVAGSDQIQAPEIMRLDDETAIIVVAIAGVDHVLTITRAPRQRLGSPQ